MSSFTELPKKFRGGRLTKDELRALKGWAINQDWSRKKTLKAQFFGQDSMPRILWVPGISPGAWSRAGKCVCVMCGYVTTVTNICRQCPEMPTDDEAIHEVYCEVHKMPHYMRKGDTVVPAIHRSINMVVVSE